ncbi:MAG: efflux RND transporter permease subunit [Planctomycetes bacterium]|nr:efflux RND transporter permease subunit [Planctomycetota bacterium]
MFLSNASIRRPIAMGCLIIGLALLGVNSYRKMALELMPQMDSPYITIVTVYPGASPEDIETDVAKRIEDAVVSIDGLKHVTSSCMENVCQTLLEFHLDIDVDIAATDVREKLDLVRADFPEDVEDPKIQKFDINAKPIITLALTGDAPLDELYDYADNTLRDRVTVISGVAEVQLIGGAEREVRIELDRRELSARGLTSTDVVAAVQGGVRTIPSGRVRDNGTEYTVTFDADFQAETEIGGLEIANRDGRRCHIRDVGRVVMSTEEVRQTAEIDGRPAVAIRVVKKADANAVEVTDSVRAAMGRLQDSLPGGMELIWVTDDGNIIEASNESAWVNVGEGILLTALILFIFLYNVRSLLVVGITMPLTVIIGLFFMQLVGFTLNNSTLIAIGMSVGVLVTNSIVVLEMIVARLDRTGDPKEASRLGASEAFIAVLASAGTNVVVLFPLAMMGSMVGRFIRPLALTMFIMTVVSLFISFTLTPMLCSLLLKPRRAEDNGLLRKMERLWNRGFDRLVGLYRRLLQFNERHRWAAILTLLVVVAMFVHSLRLAGSLGSSMVADTDRGEIYIKLELPTEYDLANSSARIARAQRLLADLPELRHILTTIGKVEGVIGQSSEGVYLAQILLRFSERTERNLTIDDLQDDVRGRMTEFPGAIVTVTVPSPIGGQSSDIDMAISGDDLKTLDALAIKSAALAGEMPGILDPDTTVRPGKPELRIRPKRPVLSDMELAAVSLGLSLRGNLEGITAGTFKRNARNYDIVVTCAEQPGKLQVERFQVPGTEGHPALLTDVATIEERWKPIQITRKDKQRISKLLANPAPDLPLGTAVNQIRQAVEEKADLPAGYDVSFGGVYEVMAEAQEALGEAGLIAVILVVLTLAAILESFKQPGLILVTLPLALIGAIWALAVAGGNFGIFEIMGLVMMVGIVVNNAILIMDQFNVLVAQGTPRHQAMIAASCDRFRPIVMITVAAVLGMLPLALSRSIGAEMRNGVGIASVGGILVSGILTLIVMPILYDLFTRRQRPKP